VADAPDDIPDGGTGDAPYQSLYRRFRPGTFAEVKGQDHVVLALRNAVRDGKVAHAYLFSGPRGTGKTSTARILAKALNCTDLRDGEPCGVCSSCQEIARGTSLDVHELDAASNNGVDAMRDLVSRAALGTPGRQKVYIVDEVHMLSTAASNALLKTLEEPPAHVVFVLATTDPQKVLPTIRSRTQHFEFRLLGADTLGDLLEEVRRAAHLEIPDEAVDVAVRRGRGSARDALSILDQVAASDTVEDDLPELDEIVEALAERDAGRALVAVAHLTSSGFSPQQLAGDLVELLRQGFLALVAPDLVAVVGTERDTIGALAEQLGLASTVRAMEVLGRSQVGMRDAPDPRVNLEVALVRLAHPDADDSPEALLARIERLEREGVARPASPSGPVSGHVPPASPVPTGPAAEQTTHVPVGPTPSPPAAAAPTPAPVGDAPTPAPVGDAPASVAATAPARRTLGAVRREGVPATAPPAATPSPGVTSPPDRPTAPTAAIAAPEGPPPAAAAPETSDGPFPTRDQLVQAWGDHILGRLRPKAKALYQAGRFVGTDGDVAVFGLPNEIHRTRCEEIRGDVEPALAEYFGRPVRLNLVVDAGPSSAPTDDPTTVRAGRAAPPSALPAEPPSTPPVEATPRAEPAPPDQAAPPIEPARPVEPATAVQPATPVHPAPVDDGPEDLSSFDESELGEVVDEDHSARARVIQAFPGAEEVG
jgi:DNA polymerase-3 subunit gamma/tau